MKKTIAVLLLLTMLLSIAACGSKPAETKPAETAAETTVETTVETEPETQPETTEAETEAAEPAAPALEDGVYQVEFVTDSSMFHINEALDGKATLTVQDGAMTVHITLVSKTILNLFPGSAEDAQKDGAEWLQPTEDEVKYADGSTDVVYGFDVPVPAVGEDFALALIGKKGVWYDHQVSVQNPVPMEEVAE